jgi:PPOX class probable F420-dependent enzyme
MITPQVAARLEEERIIWMTTVRSDGQPQSAPVWYVLKGGEIRVWSLDGVRVANLGTNRNVNLHLNSDEHGDSVVIIEGEATIDHSIGPASADQPYVVRYQSFVDGYGWTWDWFDAHYPVPIRVRPTKERSW